MTRKLWIAVAAQIALMLIGLVSPLAVMITGTKAYLETAPVDPRALFRGDYVILGYAVGQGLVEPAMVAEAKRTGEPVYVTVTTDRPARLVAVGLERPHPGPDEVCLVGRLRRFGAAGTVDFPQIAQYFVPEGEGRELERQVGGNLLAEVRVSRRCNAVLVGLETR